jgi:hypothetical protein
LTNTKSGRIFMNMAYGYDAVGNVKTLANNATIAANLYVTMGSMASKAGACFVEFLRK